MIAIDSVWRHKKKPIEVRVTAIDHFGVSVRRVTPRRRMNPGPLVWLLSAVSLHKNYELAALVRLREPVARRAPVWR